MIACGGGTEVAAVEFEEIVAVIVPSASLFFICRIDLNFEENDECAAFICP